MGDMSTSWAHASMAGNSGHAWGAGPRLQLGAVLGEGGGEGGLGQLRAEGVVQQQRAQQAQRGAPYNRRLVLQPPCARAGYAQGNTWLLCQPVPCVSQLLMQGAGSAQAIRGATEKTRLVQALRECTATQESAVLCFCFALVHHA